MQPNSAINEFVGKFSDVIIDPIILLLFALAFLVFLFGVVEMIWKSDNEEGKIKGRKHILWGLIGLFIMVAVLGIIQVLKNTFGIQ